MPACRSVGGVHAGLIADAGSDSLRQDLAAIESAGQRLTFLAAAWRELDSLDPPVISE